MYVQDANHTGQVCICKTGYHVTFVGTFEGH